LDDCVEEVEQRRHELSVMDENPPGAEASYDDDSFIAKESKLR
jgi:hypothetical protein